MKHDHCMQRTRDNSLWWVSGRILSRAQDNNHHKLRHNRTIIIPTVQDKKHTRLIWHSVIDTCGHGYKSALSALRAGVEAGLGAVCTWTHSPCVCLHKAYPHPSILPPRPCWSPGHHTRDNGILVPTTSLTPEIHWHLLAVSGKESRTVDYKHMSQWLWRAWGLKSVITCIIIHNCLAPSQKRPNQPNKLANK